MLRKHSALRQLARPVKGAVRVPRRTFLAPRSRQPPGRAIENLNFNKLSRESKEYQRNRQLFLICGAFAGIVSFAYTAYKLKKELEKPAKLDANLPPTDPFAQGDAANRKVVVHDAEGREIVPTGNNVVPSFPRTIEFPSDAPPTEGESTETPITGAAMTEYTLVGLGLRTVTFLGIGVYVMGYYIATADVAALQNALVKKVNPVATTLIPGEKDELRTALLDHTAGEEIWDELLAQRIPARSAFRIVPVRDTNFPHLRDGLVRAIQARTASSKEDEGFGEAMRQFKRIFNHGTVPTKKELILMRDGQGKLAVMYDDGRSAGKKLIGVVDDERISHALWLNYLAGKQVASEPARASIVEGIMEFVERPVGTVAAQVV